MMPNSDLRRLILQLTRQRGAEKSICPSEVARAASAADWRALMPEVRRAAEQLANEGRIVILQQGREATPGCLRGPIRLRQGVNP